MYARRFPLRYAAVILRRQRASHVQYMPCHQLLRNQIGLVFALSVRVIDTRLASDSPFTHPSRRRLRDMPDGYVARRLP